MNMNRNRLSIAVALLAAMVMSVAQGSAAQEVDADQGKPLPRVLLIGDSIMGGYYKGVGKALAGKAEVVKGATGPTGRGLEQIDAMLGNTKWDVIHFNWGLHDLAYRNPKSKNFGHLDKVDGKLTTSLADYEKNLRKLVARLKKTGATLVWASTTPVPDGEPGRIKGDAVKYNAVAAKIMAENGIAIDDLHAEVIRQGRPKTNNVHDTGNLSKKVADSILAALAGRKTAGNGILWSDEPVIFTPNVAQNLRYSARHWEKTVFPLGNGRLGCTVFGEPRKERIQFNEDSMWVGNEDCTGGYQPFGDVYVEMDHGEYRDYRRETAKDRTLAMKGVTEKLFWWQLHLEQPRRLLGSREYASNKIINLDFEAQASVLNTGGTVTTVDNTVVFENCDSLTILLGADTNYLNRRDQG